MSLSAPAFDIDFDPEAHAYQIDGQPVINVTGVLDDLERFWCAPEILERARLFGSAVHTMTELYDQDDLDETTLDNALVPYLNGYKRFLDAVNPKIEHIELRVGSKRYGYAGTLDRVMKFGRGLPRCMLDIKSGARPKTVGLQTAAYADALDETYGIQVSRRYCLQLMPNDYRLHRCDDPLDLNIWRAALITYNWKHGSMKHATS